MSQKLPTYFISHGGGPWPWIANMRRAFAKLEQSLVDMVSSWEQKPKAILMVSGHWEQPQVSVMSSATPPMVYDYYGFPQETYEITYPAPGAPVLAQQTLELLQQASIDAKLDEQQGFDHGTFAPLEVMYPKADVPVYQISILHSYSPDEHFKIGQALSSLREMGVMIIGSGLSYHNLSLMGHSAKTPSTEFDQWLRETLQLEPDKRKSQLQHWQNAPYARVCHPKEDHLVPLFVALGAAEEAKATRIYHEENFMGGATVSSYRFD